MSCPFLTKYMIYTISCVILEWFKANRNGSECLVCSPETKNNTLIYLIYGIDTTCGYDSINTPGGYKISNIVLTTYNMMMWNMHLRSRI